jgi:hypothetical protein
VISSTTSHRYVKGALLTNRHTAVSQAFARARMDVFPTALTFARLSTYRAIRLEHRWAARLISDFAETVQ